MTDVVRAKMQCHSMATCNYSPRPETAYAKVTLGAVYGSSGENKDFADATPSGECWMQINQGRPAASFFVPGKKYYVTFVEAPD